MTPEEKEICAQWWADRLIIEEKRGDSKNVNEFTCGFSSG